VPGEFTVRVDFDGRRLSVVCTQCRDALAVGLGEPVITRLLTLFASNHRHEEPTPFAGLRSVAAVGEPRPAGTE
jgi:hypothetical protein